MLDPFKTALEMLPNRRQSMRVMVLMKTTSEKEKDFLPTQHRRHSMVPPYRYGRAFA